jgi:hypothetical protein
MADTLSVTIVGGAGLKRKLARLERSMRGEVLENATVAGALLVANRMKQLAAVRTGTLRRSIHVGGHTDRTPDFAQGPAADGVEFHDIGGARRSRDEVEVHVGTDVPYAARIEYGFVGADSLGRRYHQVARPFARPAFDETRDAVTKEVGEAVKDQLRAIAGGRL